MKNLKCKVGLAMIAFLVLSVIPMATALTTFRSADFTDYALSRRGFTENTVSKWYGQASFYDSWRGPFLGQPKMVLAAATCPPNDTVSTILNECGNFVTYTTPSGGILVAGLPSGSFFPKGNTIVTFQFIELFGFSTCSFNIRVEDHQAPAITCPSNVAVNVTPNTCSFLYGYTPPVGTDNCPGVTTTLVSGPGPVQNYPELSSRYFH